MSDHFPYVILRLSDDGSLINDAPREMPRYDGKGASKALLHAIERAKSSATCGSGRLYALHTMALEQVEREQAREQERVS
jgi:hypothetical protein